MPIPKEFLELLACTVCKSELTQSEERLLCSNPRCNLRFPVRENIPIMLIEEAERPCPKCAGTRDWKDESRSLVCAKCGETLKIEER
jgi:uncharacterized protein YbaR (Trm112 family)